MIIEVQFLIAFFLAFTASILALKLGQAGQKKERKRNNYFERNEQYD